MQEQPTEPGPSDLIAKDGRALHYIAAAAGVSIDTVLKAKQANEWPPQRRTREALRRALGVEPPDPNAPAFPILIRSVEECEAVLARLKANQHTPQPVADAIPQAV